MFYWNDLLGALVLPEKEKLKCMFFKGSKLCMCPTVPQLMLHVRGKPCLLQELLVYIFCTFHNVFAEILWHF